MATIKQSYLINSSLFCHRIMVCCHKDTKNSLGHMEYCCLQDSSTFWFKQAAIPTPTPYQCTPLRTDVARKMKIDK